MEIENNFYLEKITELQAALRIAQAQIRRLTDQKHSKSPKSETEFENTRLTEQNVLLEKQNQILKRKLK